MEGTDPGLDTQGSGKAKSFSLSPQGRECLKKERTVTYVEMFLRGGGRKQRTKTCLSIPPQEVLW